MNATQLELKKAELARQIPKKEVRPIPGLAYTVEERRAELRQAEKEFEQGAIGIPHEEFMKQMKEKIQSWK